jgi:hypothetical protein
MAQGENKMSKNFKVKGHSNYNIYENCASPIHYIKIRP